MSNRRFIPSVNSLTCGLMLAAALATSAFGQASQQVSSIEQKVKDELTPVIQHADALRDKGNYDEAIPLLEKSLAVVEEKLGKEHPYAGVVAGRLAMLYSKKGRYAEAEPLFLRGIAIRERIVGPEHYDVAAGLTELARLYVDKREYDRAQPLFERALAIDQKVLGPEDERIISVLGNLAGLFKAKRDYDRAEPLYQRALAMEEKKAPEDPRVAWLMNDLATLYRDKGDYEHAGPLYQRALALFEKALGPEHPNVAFALNNLARLRLDQGDYPGAEAMFRRALAIREKVLGPEHSDVAVALNNLAAVYKDEGNYKSAEPLLRRSETILEKTLGPEQPVVAMAVNNLAGLYWQMGDYVHAEPLYQRSLAILEKALGPEHPNVATALDNLATLYDDKGDFARAEPLYHRALAIREKALGPEHQEVAITLTNLGTLYDARDDHARAEPLFQRALTIREKILGPEHPQVADALSNLAALYQSKKDYVRAEPLYRRALAIQEKTLGLEHPNLANTLNNLASLYHEKGDLASAEPLYQRALAIREKALGTEHPDVAVSLNNLALLNESKGDPQKALLLIRRAAEIEEHNLALIIATGSESQKSAYMATLTSNTDVIVSQQVQSAEDDRQALSLALTAVLQRKGRVLEAMADGAASLRRRLDPQDRDLLNRLVEVRSELAALAFNPSDRHTSVAYQTGKKTLEEESQDLESKISARSAEFRTLSDTVSVEEVQASIPARAALVEIIEYTPFDFRKGRRNTRAYAAYVLPRTGEPAGLNLGGAAAIDRAVSALRASFRDPTSADAKQRARELDELVMQPIRKLLGDTRRVLISPDGLLNLVPFGALVDEQDHYLAEAWSFTYLSSGRDVLRLRLHLPPRQGPTIFADPRFDLGPGAGRQASGRRSSGFAGLQFPDLPGTAEEAKALGSIFQGARVITGADATEASLKGVQGPSILHLATHGFFLEDQPQPASESRGLVMKDVQHLLPAPGENPLLRSGLVFAGVRNGWSGNNEDGVLTALEASSLDLVGTKLVVLSACDTGVGDVANGEGVYGLRRAFVLAGAESQVMSLWPVSDSATRELMVDYYKRLEAGEGRTEAMRQAQLKMLHNPKQSHPYYWASFIQSGDWTSVK